MKSKNKPGISEEDLLFSTSCECTNGQSIIPEIPDRQLLENLFDGVYYVDHQRRIHFWNKGAERITGYTADEMVGKSCPETLMDHRSDPDACPLCTGKCPLASVMETGTPDQRRVYLRHKLGHWVPVDVHATPLVTAGKTIGVVEIFRDASAYVKLEQANKRLEELAYQDALTKVPGRRWMMEQLSQELERAQRYREQLTVGLVDVDSFKSINDRHGHLVGDEVLKALAEHFRQQLRSTDLFGRIGGDEFLLILLHSSAQTSSQLIARILESLENVEVAGLPHSFSVSVGLGECNLSDEVSHCIDRADRALIQAKQKGKNQVRIFQAIQQKPALSG